MQGAGKKIVGRDREAHLREIWGFILRNRLLAVGVPIIMVAATAIFVWSVTPVYDATTWIRIDEERSSLPVLDALKDLSSGSQLGTEMQVLRRRPYAEAIVDSLALQATIARPRGTSRADLFSTITVSRQAEEAEYRLRRSGDGFRVELHGADEPIGIAVPGSPFQAGNLNFTISPAALEHDEIRIGVQTFQDAVKSLRESLEVSRPDREANIVVVRYQGTDRELVRDVPNRLAQLFIVERQGEKRGQAMGTVDFLEEHLETLQGQLREAEEEVRSFRERERLVSLELEGKAMVDRLAKLQAERDVLDAERIALAEMVQEIAGSTRAPGTRSPYRKLFGHPSLLKNPSVAELFRQLAEVDAERSELLMRRTEADPDVVALGERVLDLEAQLHEVAISYLAGLVDNVSSLDAVLAGFYDELSTVPAREVEFARLQRRAKVLQEIYLLLQTRLQESQIVAAVVDNSVRIVEPAALPRYPIKPNRRLSLVLALILGGVLGGGIAFVRENMDNTIHTREDLSGLVADVPVLGLIPRIRVTKTGAGTMVGLDSGALADRLVASRDPRSPVSEAYRSLRTNISFSRMGEPPRTLVFTSPTPGDGKSTSAANLAITLAQQGLNCLLIDADMRRGVLNESLGVAREPGLSNLLFGRGTAEGAVVSIALDEGVSLDFLPTGTIPPNPAELVATAEMQKLLEEFATEYDMVILDAPPLTLVTDAAILGTYADGVVLVARAGVTDRGAIAYALEQLNNVRAPILGAILNDVDQKREQYYGSYSADAHSSYYGTAPGV